MGAKNRLEYERRELARVEQEKAAILERMKVAQNDLDAAMQAELDAHRHFNDDGWKTILQLVTPQGPVTFR
jgi:hypothetical protein